jgi:hypothetical protein
MVGFRDHETRRCGDIRMTNPLWKLRDWLTVEEAAELLSDMLPKPVTKADVLRSGLDGHLKLSVFLPHSTIANCWDLAEHTSPPIVEPGGADVEQDDGGHDSTGVGIIDGVWDLPMVSPGSLQVENWFNELHQLPQIRLDGLTGAIVERPGIHCRIRAEGAKYSSPPSVLPAGSSVVVRTSAIIPFASTLSEPDPLQKPVGESERTTLLIIIAVLADKAHIDRSKPYGKGTKDIADATELIGAAVSEKTIGNYFKLIPDAIATRSK